MKVLGVIPARGGSKGVKNKNIKALGSAPLIEYTIKAANASKLSRTIVSTDSPEIAEIAKSLGGDVPFLRPDDLASDKAKAIPVIQHALAKLAEEGEHYDAVMMLQPTTPFRRVEDIDGSINKMIASDSDSVISVVDVEGHHPARMKFLGSDGRLIDPEYCEEYENQPRQELETMYIRNGAIYLTKTSVLNEGSFKGEHCQAWPMPSELSVNIDTEMDFAYAEWVYEKFII